MCTSRNRLTWPKLSASWDDQLEMKATAVIAALISPCTHPRSEIA